MRGSGNMARQMIRTAEVQFILSEQRKGIKNEYPYWKTTTEDFFFHFPSFYSPFLNSQKKNDFD
jgi:hypothetical protein